MTALLASLARVFATLSLVSIGGANAALPEIRRQVVEVHGWMTDAAFANAFALSNAAPGPNVILVSLIGWQLAGVAGLLVATLAITVPSCALALVAARMLGRWSDHQGVALLKAGLVPIALGLILASGVSMVRLAGHGAVTIMLAAGAALFLLVSARNPLWALAGCAGLGVVARQFGWQ